MNISREFTFDMAHRLPGHPGLCSNLHGHTYRLVVTICGRPNEFDGMVMDFGDLKKIVQDRILDSVDHALAISDGDEILAGMTCYGLKYQAFGRLTTAENLVREFWEWLKPALGTRLYELHLYETPGSWASYDGGDE